MLTRGAVAWPQGPGAAARLGATGLPSPTAFLLYVLLFFLSKLLMYLGVSGLSGGLRGLPCIRQDLSLQSTDPPVMAGLSCGPRGLPCIRQDLQSMDPQSWQGSAVAHGVFLVSGRIRRAQTPPVMVGLSGGPRGLPCIRQDLQSVDPQSWRGSELAYGLLSAWASAPAARGLPPRPCAAKMLRSTWDSCYPAQDRTCVPCIARQVLNCWTTREVSLLYF